MGRDKMCSATCSRVVIPRHLIEVWQQSLEQGQSTGSQVNLPRLPRPMVQCMLRRRIAVWCLAWGWEGLPINLFSNLQKLPTLNTGCKWVKCLGGKIRPTMRILAQHKPSIGEEA